MEVGQNGTAIKLVLLGDDYSGKTTLVYRYKDGAFNPLSDSTVGVCFYHKKLDEHTSLQIWDTMGQIGFAPMIIPYFKEADAVMMCYDITNKSSLNNLELWNIKCEVPERAVKVLVGCKCDLEDQRAVPETEAKERVGVFGQEVEHFETSAKTGHNVENVFNLVASKVMKLKRKSN